MTEKQEHLKNTLKKVLPRNVAYPLLVDALAAFFGVRLEFIERTKWALLHTDSKYTDLTNKVTAAMITLVEKKGKLRKYKREEARYKKLRDQIAKLEADTAIKAQSDVDQVIDGVILNLECIRSMDRVMPVGENALSLLESLSSYRAK